MFKKCLKCKLSKPLDCFHKNKGKALGIQAICKSCRSQVDKLRYKTSNKSIQNNKYYEYKKSVVNEYKEVLGCYLCGEKDYRCLDFHHLNPNNKVSSVSKLTHNRKLSTIFIEILKCVVICANCHRKLHYK